MRTHEQNARRPSTASRSSIQRPLKLPAAVPSRAASRVPNPAAFDFSTVPPYGPHEHLRIQPKLTIGPSGDAHEQEADRIAEQVMRKPAPAQVQAKPIGASRSTGIDAPSIVHEVLHSPGRPLDTATRAFMEPRFGRDFSHVRVHADALAAESAAAIEAHAYTSGNHIVFAPEGVQNPRLLAHELTHTLQQKGQSDTQLQRTPSGQSHAILQDDEGKREAIKKAVVEELSKTISDTKVVAETTKIAEKIIASRADLASAIPHDIALEATMRYNLVHVMDFAVGSGKFEFPGGNMGYQTNPNYWEARSPEFDAGAPTGWPGQYGYERNIFRPKGDDAALAVGSLFNAGGNKVFLDCNATMVAVQYQAMLSTFGPGQFNKMFPKDKGGLYIGPVGDDKQQDYPLYGSSDKSKTGDHPFLQTGMYERKEYKEGSFTSAMIEAELIVGDWVYFKNHSEYERYSSAGMWQGEHALYVGEGNFTGAAVGILSFSAMLEKLQDAYVGVYQVKKDSKNPKRKMTKDEMPGIVVRLRPNIKNLERLPKKPK